MGSYLVPVVARMHLKHIIKHVTTHKGKYYLGVVRNYTHTHTDKSTYTDNIPDAILLGGGTADENDVGAWVGIADG